MKKTISSMPKIIFPKVLQDLSTTIDVRKVVPFTSKLNENKISSLLISCKVADLDYQKLATKGLRPNTRFRMYNIKEEHYCMEIELQFEGRRTFKLHLDPSNLLVTEYLKTASECGTIGFHFVIEGNPNIVNLFTEIDEEDADWFARNHKLSEKMDIDLGYEILSEHIGKTKVDSKKEILFNFYQTYNKELLIDHASDTFVYS